MDKVKKIFNLNEIKCLWLLLLSIVAFVLALYFNRLYPDIYTKVELIIYGLAFILALLWSILNYIGHLKISEIYKKHDNIKIFIEHLQMSKDEKVDLEQYLNDFVKDLEKNGSTHDEAVKTAISNFQVKEFTESQGIKFETRLHFYLLGYVVMFVGIIIVIQLLDLIISMPFIVLATSFILGLYCIAFVCLFFIYKLMDILITKR